MVDARFYSYVEMITPASALKSAPDTGDKKAVHGRDFCVLAAVLVVVCVLLLVSIAVLVYLAITMTNQRAEIQQLMEQKSELLNRTQDLSRQRDVLQNSTEQLMEQKSELENRTQLLSRDKNELLILTQDLSRQRDVLQNSTERLMEQKSELENRTQDLSQQRDVLQNSTKQLMKQKSELENRTQLLSREKNELLNLTQDLGRQRDSFNWTLGVIMMFTNFPVNSFCPQKQCQPCLSGWILFKDHCYFFFNETSSWKQWDQSQTYCKTLNPISDLVVIESLEEQEFIYNHTQFYHDMYHGFWIGLSQIANNNWVWVNGQTDTLGFWMKTALGLSAPKALMIPNQPLTESWSSESPTKQNKFICESKALIKV